MKKKIILGEFGKIKVCPFCGWFYNPLRYHPTHHSGLVKICPACGEEPTYIVGQYRIEITKPSWWRTGRERIVGFVEKPGKRPTVPKPAVPLEVKRSGG